MGILDRLMKPKALSLTTDQILNLMTTGTYGQTTQVTDAFTQIPIVNACVSTKASNLSRVPLKFYKGDTEITSGPVVNLFKYPNPQMSQAEFIYWFDANINLFGNSYAYWDDVKQSLPAYFIFATNVKPLYAESGWINAYEIKMGNSTIRRDKEMVLHSKYYSHNSQSLGVGPLTALRQKVELSYAADNYNAKFFAEDATPSTAFSIDRPLSPMEMQELSHKLVQRRKGSREAMILSGGIKVEQLGISQKDADFVNLYKLSREEICAVFGVPESEINIFTETKFANAAVGSLAFWEKTLIPEGNLITESINRQVLQAVDIECRFDFNQIDVISRAGYGERVDQAVKLINVGFDINEVNEVLNLGFDPDVERERPSMGNLFGGSSDPKEDQEDDEEDEDEEDTKSKNFDAFKMAQSQKWHRYEKAKGSLSARMRKALKDYFHRVERKILAIVGTGKGAGWTVNKVYDEGQIRAAFDDDELDAAIEEFLKAAFVAGAQDIAGVTLNAASTLKYLQEKLIKVHVVNDTARNQVIDKIRGAISASLERGEDYRQRASMIKLAVGDSLEMTRGRAETIARTELGSAYNHAGYQAAMENGAKGIRWIATPDSLTRDDHSEFDGQVRLDGDPYVGADGGTINYPGDPNAPANQVINCRCAYEPIYEGDI
jgi:HK97 family phage portal protein